MEWGKQAAFTFAIVFTYLGKNPNAQLVRTESSCTCLMHQAPVVMDATPFYDVSKPLRFRAIPDGLVESHLEGSECCLIHADSPLSPTKGVWLNPSVRVGYSGLAYDAVHGECGLSPYAILAGLWTNRLLRWFTTTYVKSTLSKT